MSHVTIVSFLFAIFVYRFRFWGGKGNVSHVTVGSFLFAISVYRFRFWDGMGNVSHVTVDWFQIVNPASLQFTIN